MEAINYIVGEFWAGILVFLGVLVLLYFTNRSTVVNKNEEE